MSFVSRGMHARLDLALALIISAVPMVGCGGGVDMDQPAEIDPIMEQEAELSDQYMMEQEASGAL
ncbi:hypothetical protein [Tautonia rosea]|uniref:hypothetical protein n=1 Tax=Tautonia rosea TaxID=2728037 RepID=UPI001473CA62|nr:hypothetical protein [Tautonia rosea]